LGGSPRVLDRLFAVKLSARTWPSNRQRRQIGGGVVEKSPVHENPHGRMIPAIGGTMAESTSYVLGQSARAARRLEIQERHFAEPSERLLR
jgi:hypothetical protein